MLRLFTFVDSAPIRGYMPVMCITVLALQEEDAIKLAAQRADVPVDRFRENFRCTAKDTTSPGVVCAIGFNVAGLDVRFN